MCLFCMHQKGMMNQNWFLTGAGSGSQPNLRQGIDGDAKMKLLETHALCSTVGSSKTGRHKWKAHQNQTETKANFKNDPL